MTHITPPPVEPDMATAFRVMSYDDLITLLCRKFGYNRMSLCVEEYMKANKETVKWIQRKLRPKTR